MQRKMARLLLFRNRNPKACLRPYQASINGYNGTSVKYYRQYVDDMFVLSKSPYHFKEFQSSCRVDMSFTMKNGLSKQMSLLDIEINREHLKFTTTVFQKHTFSGTYTAFDSFLPSAYDLLANKQRFSHMLISKFQSQFTLFKEAFQKSVAQKTLLIDPLKGF